MSEPQVKWYGVAVDAPLEFVRFAAIEAELASDVRVDVNAALRAEFGPVARIKPCCKPFVLAEPPEGAVPSNKNPWCLFAKNLVCFKRSVGGYNEHVVPAVGNVAICGYEPQRDHAKTVHKRTTRGRWLGKSTGQGRLCPRCVAELEKNERKKRRNPREISPFWE